MPSDDDELLARFNRRLAAIESEIPSPPEPGFGGAGPTTRIAHRRSSAPGWIGASVVAAVLVALAVIAVRMLPGPTPTPSVPAVGQSSPSPVVQTPSPASQSTEPSAATPTATGSPTITPTATPPPPPTTPPPTSPSVQPATPTPASVGWIGPDLIASEHYEELSLVVDRDGYAHAAAVAGGTDSFGDGMFYLTNSSGTWTRERLTTPPADGYDGQPSMVIRPDGSLAIAFARFDGLQCSFGCTPVDPQGIFLITNRSGGWSDEVPIIEGGVQEPSLQATEDRLHLAYSRGAEDRVVEYASAADDSDAWTTAVVGEGRSPSLRIGRDGLARIAYYLRPYGVRSLFYAVQADSTEFVIEGVPGEWASDTTGSPPLLALDPTDEPQIVFSNDNQTEPECGALAVRRTAGRWSDASKVFPEDEFCQLSAAGIATDSDGILHVISSYNLTSMGIWYANDAGGEFRARQFRGLEGRSISDVPNGAAQIALDDFGRPHVLYVILESKQGDDDGLWFGIGPAD